MIVFVALRMAASIAGKIGRRSQDLDAIAFGDRRNRQRSHRLHEREIPDAELMEHVIRIGSFRRMIGNAGRFGYCDALRLRKNTAIADQPEYRGYHTDMSRIAASRMIAR